MDSKKLALLKNKKSHYMNEYDILKKLKKDHKSKNIIISQEQYLKELKNDIDLLENNSQQYKNKLYRITHKTGRCRSGADKTGIITHAVINNNAICGQNPRKKSGWSEYNDKIITCKKCLKILEKE